MTCEEVRTFREYSKLPGIVRLQLADKYAECIGRTSEESSPS